MSKVLAFIAGALAVLLFNFLVGNPAKVEASARVTPRPSASLDQIQAKDAPPLYIPLPEKAIPAEVEKLLTLSEVILIENPAHKTAALLKLISGAAPGMINDIIAELFKAHLDGRIPDSSFNVSLEALGARADKQGVELVLGNPTFIKQNPAAISSFLGALSASNPDVALASISKYKLESPELQSIIYETIPDDHLAKLHNLLKSRGLSNDAIDYYKVARNVTRSGLASETTKIEENFQQSNNTQAATNDLLKLSNYAAAANPGSLLKFIEQIADFKKLDVNSTGALTASVATLSKIDLENAMTWAAGSPPSASRSIGLSMIVNEAMSQNPDRALEFVKSFKTDSVDDNMNLILGLRNGIFRSDKLNQQEKADLAAQVEVLLSETRRNGVGR